MYTYLHMYQHYIHKIIFRGHTHTQIHISWVDLHYQIPSWKISAKKREPLILKHTKKRLSSSTSPVHTQIHLSWICFCTTLLFLVVFSVDFFVWWSSPNFAQACGSLFFGKNLEYMDDPRTCFTNSNHQLVKIIQSWWNTLRFCVDQYSVKYCQCVLMCLNYRSLRV